MRSMLARVAHAAVSFALLGSMAGIGCAGSMAEISRDERDREDEALLARGYHDDVVRLVGDAEAGPVAAEACPDVCPRLERVEQLAERICGIARRDDHDEATEFLCEDSRARKDGLAQRLGACSC